MRDKQNKQNKQNQTKVQSIAWIKGFLHGKPPTLIVEIKKKNKKN